MAISPHKTMHVVKSRSSIRPRPPGGLRSPKAQSIVIPALHPNAGVRHWYKRQLDALIDAAHMDIGLQLGVVYVTNKPTLVADGLASDAGVSKVQKTLTVWANRWQRRFDKLSLDIATRFADKAFGMTEVSMQSAFKRAGFTVKFAPTKPALEAYKAVIAENVNLIKSIPSQYLKDVQTSVWSSVRVGGDMATLSRKIQRNYDVSVKRAALIARDQNAKATSSIENTRRQQLGITTAIWQHSAGGKEPRPTHVAMNGQPYDLAKGMWDEDENEWVYPGQLINCRCTSRAVIEGFED